MIAFWYVGDVHFIQKREKHFNHISKLQIAIVYSFLGRLFFLGICVDIIKGKHNNIDDLGF